MDCVCTKNVSYSDSLIKFKHVSGLLDSEIKEGILRADDKSLEETVKAIEAKESAKWANSFFLKPVLQKYTIFTFSFKCSMVLLF